MGGGWAGSERGRFGLRAPLCFPCFLTGLTLTQVVPGRVLQPAGSPGLQSAGPAHTVPGLASSHTREASVLLKATQPACSLGLEQSPALPWTSSAALGTLPTSHQPQEGSVLDEG